MHCVSAVVFKLKHIQILLLLAGFRLLAGFLADYRLTPAI